MAHITKFNEELKIALDQRRQYLDSDILAKTKESFKLYHSSFNAVFQLLLKKALIREDPYKHEYKVIEISMPSSSAFTESDKEAELGIRMSFFNTQLDHIDGRYVFNCEYLTSKRIKLLKNLLSYIDWGLVTETSENAITRALAEMLRKIRQGTDQIAISLVNTSVTQMSTIKKILFSNLEMVRDFHNEAYKLLVRQKIFELPNISSFGAGNSADSILAVVKKKFPEVLVDQPFVPELINEIISEEFSPDSAMIKNTLMAKLSSFKHEQQQKKEKAMAKKQPSINELLNAALTTCSVSGHVRAIIEKLENNFTILLQPKGSAFMKWLHKAFGVNKNQGKVFDIEYLDEASGIKKIERLDVNVTMQKYQAVLSVLGSDKVKADFSAVSSIEKRESYLMAFVDENNKRLKSIIQQVEGIDKYIKNAAKKQKIPSSQIKGSLVEINAIKNAVIKSRQQYHEYIASKEEYSQLKSLGETSGKPVLPPV
ncbi:MAG: hypothetical protein FWC36_02510 [Spirochaetes bacterium]|nr:hypothetical protein [Spirochaetota bacterium]